MVNVDITVVINVHREGLLALSSLKGAAQAIRRAESTGIKVEALAVLDEPDPMTREIFDTQNVLDCRQLMVEYGDPGLSRNHGVGCAEGRWVALLDADDVWGENWLSESYIAAESDARDIVWHPEINIYFSEEPNLFRHIDMESEEFDPLSLIIANYWTALCFCGRSLLLEVPHRATDFSAGFGHEDWAWNMDIIAWGAIHKVVPGTGHGIRQKSLSQAKLANAAGAVPRPTELYRKLCESAGSDIAL